ncbi:MAG: 2-oxo acid dehydrogenase subunit E2 [Actinomycetota bacterium]|uniref:dihydrolipoamide acetyltransferase family protein n=1 Tax=Paenarthrobacter sp. PH39-S1 TaxID=3046204 RepID=UPI0024BABC70|nr:dihydrolipoamide acetyltransferase family protein [Paenarthrobacter sp. PH39-S1]MDJ0357995.1 dihydrolipoamide acetyltransferase family protein [Paenarthrobacter sp. PH39-S1]MDQ6739288.1 2-oxo acid dehydrogenase subunit E2 [Actinomycetota bacterium]
MIKEFRLPDLGEGLTESEIVAWKVAVGDTVTLNQVIAEVETAKAVVELPSPYAGVIAKLHEQPGTVVEVGSPIVSFELPGADDGGSDGAAVGAGSSSLAEQTGNDGFPGANQAGRGTSSMLGQGTDRRVETADAKRVPTLVGYGAEVETNGHPARRRRRLPAAAVAAAVGQADVPAEGEIEPPRSTPPVRKLAKDLGVSLAAITGTGPNGLIVREDVLAAVSDGLESTPSAVQEDTARRDTVQADTAREIRTPIKGVRKHTAAAMVASAFTAPHVSEFLTVDVTPTMDLLAKLKGSRGFVGYKLTPLTLVAKALCIAAGRQPSVNSRWDEANGEIITMNYLNLGIAAATPRGLMVPNIKDAQAMNLMQISAALTELTDTARAGKTTPAALSGGTISITNIGVFGIDAGTPILNPGEAAILAMGAVRRQPWEYNGEVALRQVMTLSLSFDHRLVDGEQGSRFLADIGTILAEPGMVLTMI